MSLAGIEDAIAPPLVAAAIAPLEAPALEHPAVAPPGTGR